MALSYAVAGSLDLTNDVKQTVLEAPSASTRLARLLPLLTKVNEILKSEVTKRNPFQGPRLN